MPSFTAPVVASWLYLREPGDGTWQDMWSKINFREMDVLYVAPLGLQSNGKFDILPQYEERLKWVINTARGQNSAIKIIVSQFWESHPDVFGYDLSELAQLQEKDPTAMATYADSVTAFLHTWMSVSGGIDGYDIDYETGNDVPIAIDVLKRIHSNFATLSQQTGGRPFYVTVSPATTSLLDGAVASVDNVNMQTYSGGASAGLTPQSFTKIGYKTSNLLFGLNPEDTTQSPTIQQGLDAYKANGLAGIHLWRLNSTTTQAQELQWVQQVYAALHPSK